MMALASSRDCADGAAPVSLPSGAASDGWDFAVNCGLGAEKHLAARYSHSKAKTREREPENKTG
jgi:hypothetical protein